MTLKLQLAAIIFFSASLLCAEHPLLARAAKLRRLIKDVRVMACYHCTRLKGVKYYRSMTQHELDDGRGGIFTCICIECLEGKVNKAHPRSHKNHRIKGRSILNKKDCAVSYYCKLHKITWTKEAADRCRPNYRPELEYSNKLAKYETELAQIEHRINALKRAGKWDPNDSSAPATDSSSGYRTLEKKVRLKLGLENRIFFTFDNGTLRAGGDIKSIGVSESLRKRYPTLYFQTPRCRVVFNDDRSDIWSLTSPLYLGVKATKIVDVKLVRSGRGEVQLRRPEKAGTYRYSPCGITFSSKQVMLWDYLPDASEYVIDIFFE